MSISELGTAIDQAAIREALALSIAGFGAAGTALTRCTGSSSSSTTLWD